MSTKDEILFDIVNYLHNKILDEEKEVRAEILWHVIDNFPDKVMGTDWFKEVVYSKIEEEENS